MLSRRHLVVLGLGRYPQLPQLLVHIPHEIHDPVPDNAEIVVIQLLAFRRHGAKQRPARKYQVFSLQVFLPVDDEILLLCAHRRCYPPGGGVAKQTDQPQGLFVDGFHGT